MPGQDRTTGCGRGPGRDRSPEGARGSGHGSRSGAASGLSGAEGATERKQAGGKLYVWKRPKIREVLHAREGSGAREPPSVRRGGEKRGVGGGAAAVAA